MSAQPRNARIVAQRSGLHGQHRREIDGERSADTPGIKIDED